MKIRALRKDTIMNNARKVSSDELKSLGSKIKDEELILNSYDEHVRFFFKLAKPIINPIKAGSRYEILYKVLGLTMKELYDIVEYRCVLINGRLLEIDYTMLPENVLVGAEIIEKYIQDFDRETRIISLIYSIGISFFPVRTNNPIPTQFEILEVENKLISDIRVIGNYVIRPLPNFYTYIKSEYRNKDLSLIIARRISNPRNSLRLVYSMTDKSNLENILDYYIIVPPRIMRPVIVGRQDTLTRYYLKVIQASRSLEILSKTVSYTLVEYINRYKQLENTLYTIMVDYDNKNKSHVPILYRIAGKEKHIRNMLGKRVDFSGRAVITIDPTLKINQCVIPEEMLPKLFLYHYLCTLSTTNKVLESLEKITASSIISSGILNDLVVLLNRQPTLHSLGFQSFDIVWSKDRSIKLNPFVCAAFNADFDGDQMSVHVPISYKAQNEARHLMSPVYNAYKPSTGEPIINPRHEMLLGLYIATKKYRDKPVINYTILDSEEIYFKVMHHEIKVYDTVNNEQAGVVLLKNILPKTFHYILDSEITSKSISILIKKILLLSHDNIIDILYKLSRIGFTLSTLYSPTLNILSNVNKVVVKDLIKSKMSEMSNFMCLYNLGLADEDEYKRKVNFTYLNIQTSLEVEIPENLLNENDGYRILQKSGARGSINNLVQTFGCAGIVNRNSSSQFPVILENSYSDGLNATEHFMTSFGARRDVIARVGNTADIGYISRLMWHSTADLVIKELDCGTSAGITIKKSTLRQHLEKVGLYSEVDKIFNQIIMGRYISKTNEYITKELNDIDEITIRSPLTCKVNCCSKCYGEDIAHKILVPIGHPIGMISAESIGELGLQLSMDTLHDSSSGVVSEFDRISTYLIKSTIDEKKLNFNYDPIAWSDGEIIEYPDSNIHKIIKIQGDNKTSVKVNRYSQLKKVAIKGEPMLHKLGDCDIDELLNYSSLVNSQLYLTLTLFSTYRSKDSINMKYFECLVSGMTTHFVYDSGDRQDITSGKNYSNTDLYRGDISTVKYISSILSIKDIPMYRNSALSTVDMELVKTGLAQSIMLETEEDFSGILESLLFGKRVNVGSVYPTYIKNRKGEK